ncbi:hypothetical protein FH972_024854 [Carpinus fangiana]|uniref:Uncharacterized protein n=1 Tax=Carpinus fangiana TaxID=176857 RepID=A0A5N6KZP9_9ROSI|nr:hypothetical protein FH972_024854 [Carpinus fangiana]
MQAQQPAMASQTLPGGMTREQAQQSYAEWQRMKQQGVPEDDPEYQKLYNIVKAIQQHSNAQKQKNAYAQQLQQQQQAATQNGHTANGADRGQGSPVVAQQPGGQIVLTDEQRSLLRQQMVAYKLLARDAPIPALVQRDVFPSQRARSTSSPGQALEAASKALNAAQNGSAAAAAAAESASSATAVRADPPRHGFEDYKSPYDTIQKHIDYLRHADRRNRLLVPGIMPPGIDYDRVREERETIIYNRIMSRKAELEKLPINTASWDTSKHDTPTPDGSKKLKALIEYKSLCLLAKQRALRQAVSREMVQADNLAMTANRFQYRRHKKQSLREARVTERLEKQQRDARESKERQRQNNQLQAINNHRLEIENAAKESKARIHRFGRLMLAQHQTIEKEEQKRVERTAKQRLQALKANDEETYLKLLGQAKDSRISHLLKQTDGFLNELAASVKSQQRSNAQHYGQDVSDDEAEEELEDDEDGGKKVDYYEVAHRVKEIVPAQSSNLVGGLLKEYQLKGLQWMISLYNNNLNGILADEMGLGKTIQTISLITYLIEKKRQPGPYLVIVPLSTLTNWNNEFEKWAPSVNRIVYKGPPNARKQASQNLRYGNFQVLLTTYEFIIKDRPVLSKIKWLHMIVDEGHRMKNANSKLSSTITQYYHTRFRLILTGTPLQNNLPELWALLNFVLPSIFKSVKSFDEWFNTPFANTGGGDNMALTEEEQLLVIRRLHKVLRPFLLRRLKKDVEKDLPDKTERVIKCRFSALQAKLYSQLFLHQRLMISDGKGGKVGLRGLSNMLMQMRKLCNHPFVFEEVETQVNPTGINNDLLWRTAGKFELLDRVLPKFRATGHRVLMFFQMTQIMNIMEDFMRLRDIPYLRLDGGTKSDDRSELLKQFNAPNSPYFCFLLSTRAGGLGLNLQTADTVIIYDSDWNPHQDLQAQDRAHRIGQKNEVRILRLITSNSVEEKILERANFKLDMDGKVIQAGKFDNRSTNEERDAMLRVMLESAEAAETAPLQDEEMDDEELNMMMMRSDDELIKFREMDAERLKNDQYGPGKQYPRLMSEAELPDIYLQEDGPVVEETAEDLLIGRGARERTKVKYDDGLTEEQWLEAVDNDEDTIEAAIARKEARKNRRQAKADRRSGVDSPMAGDDASESEEDAAPKKRSRKSGSIKRKAEDAALDSEPTHAQQPRKRGRKPKPSETLSVDERETLQKVLDTVYDTTSEAKDTDGRDIIDAFLDPVPKSLVDYHILIKNPICMDDIAKRINDKIYQGCDEFARDMRLMCNNAMTFNEEGSLIYQDAVAIDATWLRLLTSESSTNAEELGRAAFTGPAAFAPGAGDGNTSNVPSGVSTPQPTGMKIRLNHGGAISSTNGGMNGEG